MKYAVEVYVKDKNPTTQGKSAKWWVEYFEGPFAEQNAHRYAQDQVECKGAFTASVEKR